MDAAIFSEKNRYYWSLMLPRPFVLQISVNSTEPLETRRLNQSLRLTSAVTPVIVKKVFLFLAEATEAGKLLAGVKTPPGLLHPQFKAQRDTRGRDAQ